MRRPDKRRFPAPRGAPETVHTQYAHHPAGRDFKGTPWSRRTARRRPVVQSHQVDALCSDERGRNRRGTAVDRRGDEIAKAGRAAHCRHRRCLWRTTGVVKGLGRARCEGRRQLRRSLRAHCRIAIETRDSPWLKRTLDQWWSSICSTDTIAPRSKSDGAELLFDTVEGDPGEGRSPSPGLYDARALVARLRLGPDRTEENIAGPGGCAGICYFADRKRRCRKL